MDGLTLMISEDGIAKVYDDTYDIIIHCESAEEQAEIIRKLRILSIPEVIEKINIMFV